MNAHWAIKYIGRPWVNGDQGPDSFDCWGFFRYVQRHEFNRDLPIINPDANDMMAVVRAINTTPERANWVKTDTPQNGDAVLMAHSKYPSHVGMWLDVDGGGVMHCIRGEGVVFSSLSSLKIAGWGRVEFFSYAGDV